MTREIDEIDTEALLYVLGDIPGRLSPYVPTPYYIRRLIVNIIAELLDANRLIVYEPGCGTADVGEELEKLYTPFYYIGVEIDPDLARHAKARITLGDIIVGDLRSPPLRSRPMIIYAYLLPRPLTYLTRVSPKDSIIVSLEYEPEDWSCVEKVREEKIDTILTIHRVIIMRVECDALEKG